VKKTNKAIAVLLTAVMLAATGIPAVYAAETGTVSDGFFATLSNVTSVSENFPRDWHETGDYVYLNTYSLKTFYCDAPVTIAFGGWFIQETYYMAEYAEHPEWGVVDNKMTAQDGNSLQDMTLNADGVYLFTYLALMGDGVDTMSFYIVIGGDEETSTVGINLDSASGWAHGHITAAIGKGFVPADIQDQYTGTITRAEFCRMAVKWVEYALGKNIDAVLAEQGKSRDANAFTDTNDTDILAAFALGITSGRGGGLFDPGGQFSREQAATMIMNTCRAIGANIENPEPFGFADIGTAAGWAVNGINFVGTNGIMSGIGGGNFGPDGMYTREQSIATFNNVNHTALLNRSDDSLGMKEALIGVWFDIGDGGYQGIAVSFRGNRDGLQWSDLSEWELFEQTFQTVDGEYRLVNEAIPFNAATDFYPDIIRIYNEDGVVYENEAFVRSDLTYFVLNFKTPLLHPEDGFLAVSVKVFGELRGSSTGDAK
jgi:hypothetical protein